MFLKRSYQKVFSTGMDVAASEFFKDQLYDLDFKNPKSDKKNWITSDKLAGMYTDFVKNFPIVSIEDPFEQDDWDAWSKFTENVNIQIVGDDLTVTNPKRIQQAVDNKACNCLLLKVNQIGKWFSFSHINFQGHLISNVCEFPHIFTFFPSNIMTP